MSKSFLTRNILRVATQSSVNTIDIIPPITPKIGTKIILDITFKNAATIKGIIY